MTMTLDQKVESLLQQIAACETQLQSLKTQLAEAEAQAHAARISGSHSVNSVQVENSDTTDQERGIDLIAADARDSRRTKWPLSQDEYKRYGRQLIMPEVGLQGQLRLKAASVLIVGCGGLGCPAAAYLAGAGVRTLGLVDGDTVEESNLHRQILHNTRTVGMSKVDSAMDYLKLLNPNVKYVPHRMRLTPDISLEIFRKYDLVLDCTDTPASRYLISDTCVLLGIPLISASALRTEGQLMVLNYPPRPSGDPKGGPCYRCVFPKPPPAESVVSCGEGGILGPVVGVMGVLQALEAIKLITAGLPRSHSGLNGIDHDHPTSANGATALPSQVDPPSLLLFSAYSNPPFRSIRLRSRRPNCASCSSVASITSQHLTFGSMDYVQFCGAVAPVSVLRPGERVSVQEFASLVSDLPKSGSGKTNNSDIIVVDVREKVQFDLCNLENSINILFSDIIATTTVSQHFVNGDSSQDSALEPEWLRLLRSSSHPIYTVCRLGNDSQLAVRKFKELGLDKGGRRWIGDVKGGLRAWREKVDHEFPEY